MPQRHGSHLKAGRPAFGELVEPVAVVGRHGQSCQSEQIVELGSGEGQVVGAKLRDDSLQLHSRRGERRVVLARHHQAQIGWCAERASPPFVATTRRTDCHRARSRPGRKYRPGRPRVRRPARAAPTTAGSGAALRRYPPWATGPRQWPRAATAEVFRVLVGLLTCQPGHVGCGGPDPLASRLVFPNPEGAMTNRRGRSSVSMCCTSPARVRRRPVGDGAGPTPWCGKRTRSVIKPPPTSRPARGPRCDANPNQVDPAEGESGVIRQRG